MKKFIKLLSILFLSVAIVLVPAGMSFAFRCGTSLVSEGDTKARVVHKCGEPNFVDSWEEERIDRDFRVEREYDLPSRSNRSYREPFLVKEKVKIDVWTYNLGSTRFTRYLTFENGILTEITTGEKGY